MDSQPTPPVIPPSGEHLPGVTPEDLRAEAPAAQAGEFAPAPVAGPGGGQAPAAPPPKLTPDEVAAAIGLTPTNAATPTVTGPATASDADVIEPEWVDKAEEVVRKTQGDPYNEEEQIEDLQKDYLLKRYGHNVANPKSDDSKPEGR
jgi:hypothetical protein